VTSVGYDERNKTGDVVGFIYVNLQIPNVEGECENSRKQKYIWYLIASDSG